MIYKNESESLNSLQLEKQEFRFEKQANFSQIKDDRYIEL